MLGPRRPFSGAAYRKTVRAGFGDIRAVLAIARSNLRVAIRHWVFWVVVGLSMFHFLVIFALIYMKSQIAAAQSNSFLANILDQIEVTGTGASYERFLHRQAANVTILLAYAAASLVATDFVAGGMNFYLSKPIGKIHYLLGKVLALAGIVAVVTWVPAMGLFVEVAVYSSAFEYTRQHTNILIAITGYSLILMFVPTLLAMAIAATLRKTAAIVVTWVGLLIVVPAFGLLLRAILNSRSWQHISLPWNFQRLADVLFGTIRESDIQESNIAIILVTAVAVVSTAVVLERLRAVEVVR